MPDHPGNPGPSQQPSAGPPDRRTEPAGDRARHELRALKDAVGAITKRVDALMRDDRSDGEEPDRIAVLEAEISKLREQLAALEADPSEEGEHEHDDGNHRQDRGRRKAAADAAREEAEELGVAQQRADAAASLWGRRVDRPMIGETSRAYRIRQLNRFKEHSPSYRNAKLDLVRDAAALDAAERQIYADSAQAAQSNEHVGPGLLREIRKRDRTGREISEFYGDVAACLAPFRLPAQRVTFDPDLIREGKKLMRG